MRSLANFLCLSLAVFINDNNSDGKICDDYDEEDDINNVENNDENYEYS